MTQEYEGGRLCRPGGGSMPSFVDGQKVDARFRGKAKYFPGTIMKDNGDGTYEIRYDDDDTEKQVKESLIRSAGGNATAAASALDVAMSSTEGGLDVFSKLNSAASALDAQSSAGSQTVALAQDAAEMASPDLKSAFAAAASTFAIDDDLPDSSEGQRPPNEADASGSNDSTVAKNTVLSPLAAAAAAIADSVNDGDAVASDPSENVESSRDRLNLEKENKKLLLDKQHQAEQISGLRDELKVLEGRYKSAMEEITRERALLEERRRVDPSRDPKLRKALESLVLLRETPTTWDRLRSSVFQKCRLAHVLQPILTSKSEADLLLTTLCSC